MSNRLFGNIHSKPTQKVGFVVKSHGFKGAVRVAIDSEIVFENIVKSGFLMLVREGRWVPYKIESYNLENESIKLEDMHNEEDTRAISGLDIVVYEQENTSTETQDYKSIIGYTLFNQDKHKIGTVKEWIQMPMHDLLEVEMEDKSILVPIHESLILNIQQSKREITLQMYEGLTDL
ncbi:MAG: 16S rRNA processing protein RimM [Bacteroidetes bacterium]|nr:16S rRNA processing protein RimM [Bacteroidota bacterium]